eukprot:SAG31_NODE_42285_length_272_cov_0.838150_1_plen_47_part_01
MYGYSLPDDNEGTPVERAARAGCAVWDDGCQSCDLAAGEQCPETPQC